MTNLASLALLIGVGSFGAGLPGSLTGLGGDVIAQLGLLLLNATPVARVAFRLVAFALQRDGTYVAITTIVLALLVYALAFGKGS